MKRRLLFSGDKGAQRFTLLREGFLVGGLTIGQDGKPKARAIVDGEARVLTALDAISAPGPERPMPGGIDFRALHEENAELTITQSDWELIERYFSAVPWSTAKAREVADLLDWFGAADKAD